ncbi:MAG TPA: hypothetical protein VGN64_01650 [Dyadobacter sp.]|jgi:hypothetical protein|nr:hypothetical protein [Dyadobacter sp.]
MDKKMIIDLLVRKDSKRKKKLYDFFRSVFDQQLSVALTAELINCELGSDLVTVYDVKYIRARIAKSAGVQVQPAPKRSAVLAPVVLPPAVDPTQKQWSDPDQVKTDPFKNSNLNKR